MWIIHILPVHYYWGLNIFLHMFGRQRLFPCLHVLLVPSVTLGISTKLIYFWTELFCRCSGRYWCPGFTWLLDSWSGKQIKYSYSLPSIRRQSSTDWEGFPSWKIHHESPESSHGRAQVRLRLQIYDVKEWTYLNLAFVQIPFYKFS